MTGDETVGESMMMAVTVRVTEVELADNTGGS